MQYHKKLRIHDCDLGVQNEFSHNSTENTFVVDEHNYFNSQPKLDNEEQIKFYIVSLHTNLLSYFAKNRITNFS